ncbi:MAG TPA: hypothetical protein DDW24_05280, partial [Blastocatellia bacterium]|nr:hypothetical protein [Blastocatellia bacterium]
IQSKMPIKNVRTATDLVDFIYFSINFSSVDRKPVRAVIVRSATVSFHANPHFSTRAWKYLLIEGRDIRSGAQKLFSEHINGNFCGKV